MRSSYHDEKFLAEREKPRFCNFFFSTLLAVFTFCDLNVICDTTLLFQDIPAKEEKNGSGHMKSSQADFWTWKSPFTFWYTYLWPLYFSDWNSLQVICFKINDLSSCLQDFKLKICSHDIPFHQMLLIYVTLSRIKKSYRKDQNTKNAAYKDDETRPSLISDS